MRKIYQTILNSGYRWRDNYARRRSFLMERGVFSYLRGSSGYVLIIVLIVTSILVSISSEFFMVAQTNINYIKKFSDRLQALSIAKAGVTLGRFILDADKKGVGSGMLGGKSADRNIDSNDDLWAIDFPEIPIENGHLKIIITDENAKINLSVLANEVLDRSPYYLITQRFFMNMGFPMDLADCILDWVDIDDARSPYGAESADYYLTLERPYKSKNREMDTIDELMMIKGITPEVFYGLGGGNFGKEGNLVDNNRGKRKFDPALFTEKAGMDKKELEHLKDSFKDLEIKIGRERSRRLADYFRVYGERADYLSDLNKININTASYRVLSALTDNMTDDIVTEIIRRRMQNPFGSPEDLKDIIDDETIRKNIITVRSYIFTIQAIGRVNNTSVKVSVTYYRDEKRFYYWSEQ